ncbi:dihydrofolate reductase [Crossiella equi]|uniref:Dihydrofolate reductase n=1 Tax=Crossiella equi TaxID=130796 RepID=A0ABS5A4Z1_9PSEU|nr:dihydrofolate reductase family protein [Crossiella equi]MBP2471643.1 dihydrofolate reductase [Crossiella equi]
MSRPVIASVTLSMDGRVAGPNGDGSWLVEHALDPEMRAYFEGVWRGADTILLGRRNYEGFHGYWPSVAADASAHPRDRAMADWMNETEKIVFSRTLTEVTWPGARLAQAGPAIEVSDLKEANGQAIIVLSSVSIIRSLLAAGMVDELRLHLLPELLGGGEPLFTDGLPRSGWRLASHTALPTGALALNYRPRR